MKSRRIVDSTYHRLLLVFFSLFIDSCVSNSIFPIFWINNKAGLDQEELSAAVVAIESSEFTG